MGEVTPAMGSPINMTEMLAFATTAKAGDRLVYYKGHLSYDRAKGIINHFDSLLCRNVLELAEKGVFDLFQKRIDESNHQYIIVRRSLDASFGRKRLHA